MPGVAAERRTSNRLGHRRKLLNDSDPVLKLQFGRELWTIHVPD
jgi:hypothetical protein